MIKKVKEYLDHLGYFKASKEARNTFLGVILVKFGTGAIGIWGIINIYFFSFYKQNDDNLRMSEFVFLITFAAIPMSVIAIFSVRIAQIYGFEKIIRSAMIINPISIMLGSTQDNFYTFALFNTFIASICFGSTVMPILYCLWSHFPTKTGNTTGVALASFGLATFFYSIFATYIVNPQNLPATIEYIEGQQTYYLFEEVVNQNVPSMVFWIGFIQLLFCIPGAFLISNNKESESLLNEENEENDEKDLEMNLLGSSFEKNIVVQEEEYKYNQFQQGVMILEQQNSHQLFNNQQNQQKQNSDRKISSTPSNKQRKKSISQQYLLEWHAQVLHTQFSNNSADKVQSNQQITSLNQIPYENNHKQQKTSITKLQDKQFQQTANQISDSPQQAQQYKVKQQEQNQEFKDQNQEQNQVIEHNQQQNDQQKQDSILQFESNCTFHSDLTLMDAIKSKPFKIIYVSTFLLSCFSLFISINFKTYGLTKINDDHFLTYIITFSTLISSISNIGWGYLVDKYNFKLVYLRLILVILAAGFLFPIFSDSKIGFYIFFQILSASERGLYTIIGPGLVKIFGMKLGAELFPVKSTSFFLALVVLPVIQFFMLKFFDYDETIHILLVGIVASYFLSNQLQQQYDFRNITYQEKQKNRV
ncbi:MFS transporter (macronuclear) [Tetrahymena thermophila SB210]|uniref:MFS transporter n=1 Tax=Tetrahymena thermophila (strain SB210) TaxID=312017 RepID=Q24CX7_TETTS|nr:MFS transporter [Tetrahymena thermophila SB210]EAS05631.2 MFS transporter [Tetrahymena thermophila SB210]|eukprot:XP_001025876.2 MFS transporter [Tetrahymena thermophila SB210]